VPIREIRGFDKAKVRVGEGADADTRGRVCSPELQADAVFLLRRVYAPLYTDLPVIAIRRKKLVPRPFKSLVASITTRKKGTAQTSRPFLEFARLCRQPRQEPVTIGGVGVGAVASAGLNATTMRVIAPLTTWSVCGMHTKFAVELVGACPVTV